MNFPRLLLTGISLVCALASPLAAAPRVALVVDAPPPVAAEWQPLLVAELTRLAPDAELIERASLARVWAERETAVLAGADRPADAPLSAASPAPLGVDRYLHFRRVAESRWIVEQVDAATGRALGAFAAEASAPADAPRLADAAARLLSAPAPAPATDADASRLAVVESADATGDAALFALAAHLRAAFAESGFDVLDRALAQELAVEQNDAARGLRASVASASLLGLDHYLEISPRDVRLLRVRDGVLLGARPRETAAKPAAEVEALRRWARPLLRASTARAAATPASAADDYLPRVEMEALAPFYRGLAEFDAGRHDHAAAEFDRALRVNGRFREAYEWSARAHEALGLPEIAAGLRRFLATEFLENQPAATGRAAPVDGLAFAGVRADDALAPAAADLSVFAASALASRRELGLRLPDQLARLRREYDWMLTRAEDSALAAEPALLTRLALSATLELDAKKRRPVLRWTLRDTLGRHAPQTRELPLSARPEKWPREVRDFLKTWPRATPLVTGEITPPLAAVSSPAAHDEARGIARDLLAADGAEAERLRLRLLQIAPEHSLNLAPPRGRPDEPFFTFVWHGRARHVIGRLPPAHPQRRWIELMLALKNRDPFSSSVRCGDTPSDGEAEIDRLIAENPDDGAGRVARYVRLFIDQDRVAPIELARRCEALRSEIRADRANIADIEPQLDLALASLARLARLASTPIPEDLAELEKFHAPTDLPELRWTAEGRLEFTLEAYAITRTQLAGYFGAELASEARALIALNGRGHSRNRYDEALLRAHPRSLALAQFVILSLDDTLIGRGAPAASDFTWDQHRAYVRSGVDYAFAACLHAYAKAAHPEVLRRANFFSTALLGVVAAPAFREIVPPAEYETLHANLVSAEAAARERLTFPSHFNPNTLPLARLTRAAADAYYANEPSDIKTWLANPEAITESLTQRGANLAKAKTREAARSWWWLARRWETREALSAPARAALLARPLDDVLRLASPEPDAEEAAQLFDLGLFLLQGKRDADAERVLARVANLPAGDAKDRARDEIVANALLRLAQTLRLANRTPEALAAARRGLELSIGREFEFIEHHVGYKHREGDLAAQLSRLLVELRHHPARQLLPPRTGFVRVSTPNADNPYATIYYRQPPPAAGSTVAAPRRALLLAPANNEDPLELLAADGAWARFADAHDLVLVAPRFVVSERSNDPTNRFTHLRHAQAWSGEATIRALELIGERTPITRDGLLIYGRASGGGFASNFAAWRPDRVAAVALSNGNWTLNRHPVAGLADVAKLRDARYWIAANPLDNADFDGLRPRYVFVREFAERLRSLGVSVEWSDWPDDDHTPPPEMEEAARAFFARELARPAAAAPIEVEAVTAKAASKPGLATAAVPRPGERVAPGATLILEFPELGEMQERLPAACQVSIPANYDPARPSPLLVWFAGGSGSHMIGGPRGLVDFDRFVVVALPYPGGRLPRLAAKDGGAVIDAHWTFQRAMLDRVRQLVPNIDPRLRFVAGTSSGGHHIAYGIDRAWPGFADYFTHFVVHEGGAEPLTDGLPRAKGLRMMVVYGEKSDSVVWRGWFNWNVHRSGARADIVGVPGAGHGLNNDARKLIRAWIDAEAAR